MHFKAEIIPINITNLDKSLQKCQIIFGWNSETYKSIVKRYNDYITNDNKEIWQISFTNSNQIIASCHLIVNNLEFLNSKVINLTNVYVTMEHRGQGYFYKLMGEVEKFARDCHIDLLLVVARKKVKDIYWKAGFHGFYNFPLLTFQSENPHKVETQSISAKLAEVTELDRIRKISNKWNLILQKRDYAAWNLIIQNNTIEFINSKKSSYIIHKNGELLEFGCIEEQDVIEMVKHSIALQVLQIPFDLVTRYSEIMKEFHYNYSTRFEKKEGHLIKILNSQYLNLLNIFDANQNLSQANKNYLEILPLDQW